MAGVTAATCSSRSKRKGEEPTETPAFKRTTRSETAARKVSPDKILLQHGWEVGQRVWIRLREKKWVDGKVEHVREHINLDGKDYDYAIGVTYQTEDGRRVTPPTWQDSPLEIPVGKINAHLRKYDKFREGLSETDKLLYRVLKRNMALPKDHDPMDDTDSGDVPSLDSVLLDDASGLSLKDQISHLMQSSQVAEIIEAATGSSDTGMTVSNTLACLLGTLAGAELQLLSSSRDESKWAPSCLVFMSSNLPCVSLTTAIACGVLFIEQHKAGEWVLQGLAGSSNDKLEQFQDFDCDIIKVFLMSVMVTRTQKGTKFDPKRGTLDSRAREVFNNDEDLQARTAKLLTALTSIHSSQS